MSYKLDLYLSRLDKAELEIFPVGSVARRIRDLPPEQRQVFETFKQRQRDWAERQSENIYELHLRQISGERLSDPPPMLPTWLDRLIYPQYDLNLSAEENYRNLHEAL